MLRNASKKWLIVLILCGFPVSSYASLIGDEVNCSFRLTAIISGGGPCSTDPDLLIPGPALVVDEGFDNPEFYIGLDVPFLSPPRFVVGAEVDIGADFIDFSLAPDFTGLSGFLRIVLSSLDWGLPIVDTIITTTFPISEVSVRNTSSAVIIEARSRSIPRDPSIRVQLVPTPSSIAMFLCGLCALASIRQTMRADTRK